MIWCPWRIEVGGARIACGSGDYEEETMLSGLAKLIGQTVTGVSVDSFLDLLVSFSNSMRLRLFCEQGEEDVGGDVCYAFYVRNEEVWSVAKGEIAVESLTE